MGNRKLGYNLAAWNCRKGLVKSDNTASEKLTDIKQFLYKNDLHLLGVIESDLHSLSSRVKRAKPISTKEIIQNLHIEGYAIKLPLSWKVHGQARILLYVKVNIKVKLKEISRQDSDLPSLSCEIGLGREKKSCVNFFYREWTGGVSGLADTASQQDRLLRQVKHWTSLYTGGRDVTILGDANLCAFKWNDSSYQQKSLSDITQDFLLETSSFQLVKDFTRSELSGNELVRSCIDHCYTDVPEKHSKPQVVSVGNSDHLGVTVTKYARIPVTKPQTVRKRSYKNFCVGSFLTNIYSSSINEKVLAHDSIEGAAKEFEGLFSDILEKHVPIKTFQMRTNYLPQISSETKLLMAERRALQEEATATGNPLLLKEFKTKDKEVKKAAKEDKKEHHEINFSDEAIVQTAWKTARELLGTSQNLSPTVIQNEGERMSNPAKLANLFNNYVIQKVRLLWEKTATIPLIDPVKRLDEEKENCTQFQTSENQSSNS